MTKFKVGDLVRANHPHLYAIGNAVTKVRRVIHRGGDGICDLITLDNPDSPYGTSDYLSSNFYKITNKVIKESPKMERTKFFAVKLPAFDQSDLVGIHLNALDRTLGDMHAHIHTTPLRDSRTLAVQDVKAIVKENDRYLVVQTVCLVEGEEPKPPVKITEYGR